ncbi:hypothetical protein V6K52_17440 [Knoellia sp. S7-12]|uniref:hypothetical protein n=1 Tax=Knoellia sp. S7-12 TaxID=3126698 RepID=UPI0033666DF9
MLNRLLDRIDGNRLTWERVWIAAMTLMVPVITYERFEGVRSNDGWTVVFDWIGLLLCVAAMVFGALAAWRWLRTRSDSGAAAGTPVRPDSLDQS